jgi:hypothetical protein
LLTKKVFSTVNTAFLFITMKISLIAIALVVASPSSCSLADGQRSQLRGVLAKTRHLLHGRIPANPLLKDEVEELAEVEEEDDVHGTTGHESIGGAAKESGQEVTNAAKSSKNADDESEDEPLMEDPKPAADPVQEGVETPLEKEPDSGSPKEGAVKEEPEMAADPEEEGATVEEPETPADSDKKSSKGGATKPEEGDVVDPMIEAPETPKKEEEDAAKGKSQKTPSDKDDESLDETVVLEDELGRFSDAPSDVPSMAPTAGLGEFSDAPSDVPSMAPAAAAP